MREGSGHGTDHYGEFTPLPSLISFGCQGLPEGGRRFLQLLQFDNGDEEIRVRTHSPSLEQYSAKHPTLEPENQDFTMSYKTAGIVPRVKELSADAFRAEVLTGDGGVAGSVIGVKSNIARGSEVTVEWTPDGGTYGWYVTRHRRPRRGTCSVATDDSGEEPTVRLVSAEVTAEGKGHRGAVETLSTSRFRLRAAPKAEYTSPTRRKQQHRVGDHHRRQAAEGRRLTAPTAHLDGHVLTAGQGVPARAWTARELLRCGPRAPRPTVGEAPPGPQVPA